MALPGAPVVQGTAEDQVARASAASTQVAASNVAVVGLTGSGAAGPDPVAADSVTQVNDVAAVAAAANLSEVTQSVLQGQLTGESVVVLPAVEQLVETRQVADAASVVVQSGVGNRVVVDGGFPAGQVGGGGAVVEQANVVSGDAAVANVSTVGQSSEQAQAVGGGGVQVSRAFASVGQDGFASVAASQLGSVNAAHLGEAAAPLVVSTVAAPVASAMVVTQVSEAAADASVANVSEVDQLSGQLQVGSPSVESAAAAAVVEQAAAAAAEATEAAVSNLVVLAGLPVPQSPSLLGAAPVGLDVVQANLASGVSVAANTSFLAQESVQSQVGAEASTADSVQVATVAQETGASVVAAQTAVGNVGDGSTLGPAGFFGQGNGAVAEVSAGNASAVGQSVVQEQLETTAAVSEAVNEASVEQANGAAAKASMAAVVNGGLYLDGVAVIDATSTAAALNVSLVVQAVDQSEEIVPPEPPKPPLPAPGSTGGGTGGSDSGAGGPGGDGGSGDGGSGVGGGGLGKGLPGGGGEAGTGREPAPVVDGGGSAWTEPGTVYVVKEVGAEAAASGAGSAAAEAGLGGSSGEGLSGSGGFEPGPNPSEVYLTTVGAAGGPDSSSSVLLASAATSVIVVDGSGVWIDGVRTALAARSGPDPKTTAEAHAERRGAPAAPADDAPPRGPPVVTATGAAGPAPGSAGGGPTAALATRASPISPDGGVIQDPPTLLVPPGAVVTLLDTPG